MSESHHFEEEDEENVEYSSDSDSETDPDFLGHISSKFSNISLHNQPLVNDKDLEIVETIVRVGQVDKLKVEQCKVYLRKYGLRLTGTKQVLIHRIMEHQEVLNGDAEKKYPVSSFVLNCKGDACTGDVVMFEQNVYDTYNIASRSASGPPCGTRIVVGRILKESYGAAKQQHTFTVEVLWSKGEKPLPPLHPLLIKGRNLYRLKTLRQRWEDEGDRTKTLMEKHSRGSLARSDRESRIQEKDKRKMLKENRNLKKEQNRSRPLLNATLQENLEKHVNVQQFSSSVNLGKSTYHPPEPVFCMDKVATRGRAQPQSLQPGIFTDKVAPESRVQPSFLRPSIYIDEVATRGRAQPPSLQRGFCFDKPATGGRAHPPSLQPQHSGFLAPNVEFRQPHHQAILPQWEGLSERNHYHDSPTLRNENRYHEMFPMLRQSYQQQQLCRHYPRGKCYYGEKCKFLHQR